MPKELVTVRTGVLDESSVELVPVDLVKRTGTGQAGFEVVEVSDMDPLTKERLVLTRYLPVPPGTVLREVRSTLMGAYNAEGGE